MLEKIQSPFTKPRISTYIQQNELAKSKEILNQHTPFCTLLTGVIYAWSKYKLRENKWQKKRRLYKMGVFCVQRGHRLLIL